LSQLTFYLGRAGSGRSAALDAAVLSHMRRGENAILIVPEQSTFAAEQRLAVQGCGLIGVQVLSVERLSERILDAAGDKTAYLSMQGLSMLTRRVAAGQEESLRVFSRAVKQTGFCAELAQLFSEMKRAGITPEALEAALPQLKAGSLLREKAAEIALLYRGTEEALAARYLTADDRIRAAIALLPQSFVRGAHVYFDELPAMTNQFFALFSALLGTAASVTVSLTDDPTGADEMLFAPIREAERRMQQLAAERGIALRVRAFDPTEDRPKALMHLEKELFAYPADAYAAEASCITIYGATGRQAEAEAAADRILELTRQGLRYRDMAVVVSDPAAYGPVLKRSLALRRIPSFFDVKHPVAAHAAAETVEAALSAIAEGFAPTEVLRLAKGGFAGIPQEDAEQLENYVLRYGVRGSGFLVPFKKGEDPAAAEQARKQLIEPLLKLREALHGRTVKEKLTALYGYLMEIRLPETLEQRAASLVSLGRPREAAEHAELWRLLMELFDQLAAILGDTPMSRDDFRALLMEGLSGMQMGVIPDTADRVLVGDPMRTRLYGGVKALFVLGANEGLLPKNRHDDGLLNDGELSLLEKSGNFKWNGSSYVSRVTAVDRHVLYTLLASAKERLYVSYSFAADETELSPAPILQRLSAMFPQADRCSGVQGSDVLPATERMGLRLLANGLREDEKNGQRSEATAALLAYYRTHPQYAARAAAMEKISEGKVSPAPLSRDMTAALYGTRLTMSASRLEQFNACPFRHFMSYGLGAELRREAKENAADLGSFFHAILEAFLRRCVLDKINFKTLTDDRAALLFDEVVPAVLASHNEGLYLYNERLHASLFLLIETAREAVFALLRQMRAGSFTPLGAELRFGDGGVFPAIVLELSEGRTVRLSGIVDRVDKAEAEGETFLRVIDYKTGGRKLDFAKILEGLTLQLPLYLFAVCAAGETPAGMYYMPVKAALPKDGTDLVKELQKQFRLSGLTLSDPVVADCTEAVRDGRSSELLANVRTTRGEYAGAVCAKSDMHRLLKKAQRIAAETAERMLSGEIAVAPAENACTFCDFRSVCRFDTKLASCRVRKLPKLKQDAFFADIRNESRDTARGEGAHDGDAMD